MNVPPCATLTLLLLVFLLFTSVMLVAKQSATKRYLYVATPGIADYVGYGGHGILVFDINNNHRFVNRIPTNGLHPNGSPSNVKGVAVSVPLNSILLSTIEGLQRIDLNTERLYGRQSIKTYSTVCRFHPMARPCTCPLWKRIFGM